MSDSIICPDCKGEGSYMALVKFADDKGCQEQRMPCHRCGGNGEVPTEMLDWIKRGDAMREDRLSRDLGQREEAKRLGISVVEYSHMEFGKVDNTRAEWAAEAEAEREAVRHGAAPIHQGHDGAPCVCAYPDHKHNRGLK